MQWVGRQLARSLLVLILGVQVAEVQADFVTLYDGTLQATTPDAYVPQWLEFGNLGGTQTYSGALQATNLNTAAVGTIQDGYSNFNMLTLQPVNAQFPSLDRQMGYTLSFRVEILSEAHTNNERAGFSVIAVSNDVATNVPSSIEIGFQDNRVFAQNDNPLFGSPAAEEAAFDGVGVGFVDYDLTVQGDTYRLSADGNQVLNGSLRDYTAFAGAIDPYETGNFLFLGDDTTSAQANINLQRVTLQVGAVPEPSSGVLLAMVAAVFAVAGARSLRNRRKVGPPA